MTKERGARGPKIEKLEAPARELTQEEAEATHGGKKALQQIQTAEPKLQAALQSHEKDLP
jgi:hypothetical protein